MRSNSKSGSPRTYVDDPAQRGLLLAKFVLIGQVAQQEELLVDTLVLGHAALRGPARVRSDLLLCHFL